MRVMEPKLRSCRGLWLFAFFLSSHVLFSSGNLLPSLHNSGSLLWKRQEASPQSPSSESGAELPAPRGPRASRLPSLSLRDWSLEWTVAAPRQERGRSQEPRPGEPLLARGWGQGWGGKRSLVVADDAAFREKSKMLTAMERQKWLNSYIQKFLLVNSE